jgi:hypothetical protein
VTGQRKAATTQGATWAARVIARYARSAEPELSSEEAAELYQTLVTALRLAKHKGGVADWIKALNAALDRWEIDHHRSGPRVDALDLISERVVMSYERVIMGWLGMS